MAVIGSPSSGYGKVEPVKNYLGESLQYINDDQFRRKQAEEEKAQRAAAASAAAQKEERDIRAKVAGDATEKFKAKATENGNFNDSLTDYAASSLPDYVDNYTNYVKTGNPEYLKRANNILASFDTFKQAADVMNGITEDYTKNADKKDPRSVQYFKENLGSMEKGNVVFHRDKNGQARLTVFKSDENGNPTDVIVKDQDVISYAQSLAPTNKFDRQGLLADFYKNNPLSTTTKDNNFLSVTKNNPEEKRGQAESLADYIVANPQGLRDAWAEMNKGEYKTTFTPDEKKKVRDYLVENTLGGYAKIYKEDRDYNAQTARAAEVRQAKKEEPASYGTVEVPPIYNNSPFKPLNGYQAVSTTNTKPITAIKTYFNGQEATLSNPKLESYTVFQNPNGQRQILAEVSYLDVKSSKLSPQEEKMFSIGSAKPEEQRTEQEKMVISSVMKGAEYKKVVVPLSESDALKYAKQLGLGSVNQMKDAAKGYSNQPQQQAQPTQSKWATKNKRK